MIMIQSKMKKRRRRKIIRKVSLRNKRIVGLLIMKSLHIF